MVAGAVFLARAADRPNGAPGAPGARTLRVLATALAGQRDDNAAQPTLMEYDEHTMNHKKTRCCTTTPPKGRRPESRCAPAKTLC